MKKLGIILVALFLAALAGHSSMLNSQLRDEVKGFMAQGGRNTAAEGFERDLKLAELEARLDNVEWMLIQQCYE